MRQRIWTSLEYVCVCEREIERKESKRQSEREWRKIQCA